MTIFRRREPRPNVRNTESTVTFGGFPVLGARVLEKGIFTGPVSTTGDAPVRASREQIVAYGTPRLTRPNPVDRSLGVASRPLCLRVFAPSITESNKRSELSGARRSAVLIFGHVTQSFPDPEVT